MNKDELKKILPYYERELALLRQSMLQFERAHPQAAVRLSISDGQADDPHVERIVQSAAWLNARSSQRIDDHYPEFTEALIETAFPAYLRPVPSCSIAHFDVAGLFDGLTQTISMPRGTALEHRPSLCRFSTAWDVTLAPLKITRAQFAPSTAAPASSAGRLPGDTAGIISVEFSSPGRDLTPDSELVPQTLRLYLHADRPLAAALTDAILLHPPTAFVEADGSRRWQALAKTPASIVGLGDAEALAGKPRNEHSALQLLIEYTAFPYKFRFIDLDFAALLRAVGPCNRLTMHFPVAGYAANAPAVQQLSRLKADHLRLFCTPVVNLFKADAKPVDVKADMLAYPVALPESKAAPAVIHSIDSVRMMHGEEGRTPSVEIPPYRSFQHWSSVGIFWLREREQWIAQDMTGCETAIKLVDLDERPVTPDATQLMIGLTCTNGDLPTTLDIGATEGDLHSETLNVNGPITMLVPPSASIQPSREADALWLLISALSPNSATLSASGLATLQELLYQFGESASPNTTRYIGGIVGLSHRSIKQMMTVESIPVPILMPGIEFTLTIDEAAFAGHALHTFARLMERYFLRYVGLHCMRLLIRSHRGAEICLEEPLLGTRCL